MIIYEQTINGELFTVSMLKFSGLCGSQSIIIDRPQFPIPVLSTDVTMQEPCTHCGKRHPAYCEGTVGTPITVAYSTAGKVQFEHGLDAVSNDYVFAYTAKHGDLFRVEQENAKFVLGPGVDTASQEDAQVTVRSALPVAFEIKSHKKILPKTAIRFNAGDQQRDGLGLDKASNVGRNWLRFNQGTGIYDWRMGMDEDYAFVVRSGRGKETSPDAPGDVALRISKEGVVDIPSYEERISRLEQQIAEILRK